MKSGPINRATTILFAVFAALCMCGIFVSCGSGGEDNALDSNAALDPSVSPLPPDAAQNDTPTTQWHNLLNSKSYSGYIAVMFKDGTDIRLQRAAIKGPSKSFKSITREWPVEFVSRNNTDVTKLNESIAARMNVAVERGVPRISEDDIVLARENAAEAGVQLDDWNLYYTIAAPEPNEAEALIEELKNDPNVRFIHPMPLPEPADDDDITTIDISGEQNYLRSNETHGGLNVIAGWEEGATGKNVVIVDEEINWNFDHEDLPIDAAKTCVVSTAPSCLNIDLDSRIYIPGYYKPANYYTDDKFIQHGTAVVGVIGGKNNNGGVKGIVYNATVKLFDVGSATGIPFAELVNNPIKYWKNKNGSEDTLKPGDVILVEVQSPGPTTTVGCSVGDLPDEEGAGCIPEEAFSVTFTAIKNAVDSGFIVVEAAGNGSLDLSSPEAHYAGNPDLGTESTGAIMVGASLGTGHEKAAWTNCGTRLDAYGWGAGVVTTGYGDHPQSTPGDPTKWYTNSFSGTSSATAMVGGAIAQIQSFVKMFYGGYYASNEIYFTAPEMKALLQATGTKATGDGNCNIGYQPDVGAAIEKIKNFEVIPTHKNIVPKYDTVVSGIRYDMDEDGKAELISFSRDHKFYVDLSSVKPQGGSPDGFGEWDLVLDVSDSVAEGFSLPPMLFPVVHDYSSDGRADLALYDSVNGKYYIKYTTDAVITPSPPGGEGGGEGAIVWDRIIDYSSDPAWKAYSRPLPGDINNDRWLDITFQTPDGYWLIDYGGTDGLTIENNTVVYSDHFGAIDNNVDVNGDGEPDNRYLTKKIKPTDPLGQLDEAPGWAWLPVIGASAIGNAGYTKLVAKTPESISTSNKLVSAMVKADGTLSTTIFGKYSASFGDNESYFIMAGYSGNSMSREYGFKKSDGEWNNIIYVNGWNLDQLVVLPPQGYGDLLCRPIPADYDGDGKDDRAVQCGTSWKIAYSTQPGTFRELEEPPVLVGNDEINAYDPLPAYVYPGGIKYTDQISLFSNYKTKLTCEDGEKCGVSDTIFDVVPPIGPYFAECVKYWAPNASYCWDK